MQVINGEISSKIRPNNYFHFPILKIANYPVLIRKKISSFVQSNDKYLNDPEQTLTHPSQMRLDAINEETGKVFLRPMPTMGVKAQQQRTAEDPYRRLTERSNHNSRSQQKACKSVIACPVHPPEEPYKRSSPPMDQYSVL